MLLRLLLLLLLLLPLIVTCTSRLCLVHRPRLLHCMLHVLQL
jgi:hypothetical protein